MYNDIISHSEYASSFFWSTTRTDSVGISYYTVNGGVSSFVDGNVFDFSEIINGRVAQPTLEAGKTKADLITVTTQFH